MKAKFDCVFYYVSDIDRGIRFYTDILGFKMTSQDFPARFDVDGVLFEIVPRQDKTKSGAGGNARLCLEVEDIDEALRDLQHKGVRTEEAKAEQGGMLASFYDPDGNEICLWQYSQAAR